MIYADINDIKKYFGICKNLDTALEYLQKHDLSELKIGKTLIDEENVFINRFDYQTIPIAECFFEAHEKYADIHVLLNGHESIAIASASTLDEISRDIGDDFICYNGAAEARLSMNSQKLLIAFPTEPHMVKIQDAGVCTVQKVVFKVKL